MGQDLSRFCPLRVEKMAAAIFSRRAFQPSPTKGRRRLQGNDFAGQNRIPANPAEPGYTICSPADGELRGLWSLFCFAGHKMRMKQACCRACGKFRFIWGKSS